MEWDIYKLNRFSLIFLIVIIFAAASCKKGNPAKNLPADSVKVIPPIIPIPPVVQTTDVYVSGNLYSGFTSSAVYWKNGTIYHLTASGINSTTTAIFVKDSDVYVAGSIVVNNVNKAVYWKNGILVTLDNGGASAITVQGSDVYIAGYKNVPVSNYTASVATYWKNGISTTLNNPAEEISGGKPNSFATGIALLGSDIYVAGWGNVSYGGGNPVSLYWKNAKPTLLINYYNSSGNTRSQAAGIYINGNDVYIAGYIIPSSNSVSKLTDISGAVYWKNGVGTQLYTNSLYSRSTCIAVQGTDIHITGINESNFGFYFENGIPYTLNITGNSSVTTGIALYNNDVYISGYGPAAQSNAGAAGYWKNTNLTILANSSAQATGITVVKH